MTREQLRRVCHALDYLERRSVHAERAVTLYAVIGRKAPGDVRRYALSLRARGLIGHDRILRGDQ